MGWKVLIKDYFNFSRKDRLGLLVVFFLLVLLLSLPRLVRKIREERPVPVDTAWMAALQRLEEPVAEEEDYRQRPTRTASYPRAGGYPAGAHPAKLFFFDPNHLPAQEWEKLGLREKTIKTILNYLAKGGHFRQPEDMKRVYGLHPDEYERLAPFIRLAPEDKRSIKEGNTAHEAAVFPARSVSSKRIIATVDINSADTTAFIALPRIGSKLAARIVAFREKLGGFYSVAQVAEIYGLADSTFQMIRPYLALATTATRKININTATLEELKAHPYIRYPLANPLLAYRKEHGPFSKLEDIKNVMAVTEEIYTRLVPYLEL